MASVNWNAVLIAGVKPGAIEACATLGHIVLIGRTILFILFALGDLFLVSTPLHSHDSLTHTNASTHHACMISALFLF